MAKKVTRRQTPRQDQDKFISSVHRLGEFASKNFRSILLGVTVVIGLGIGWAVIHHLQVQRAEKAADLLRAAQADISRPGETAQALAALKNLISQYPNSGAAFQARLWRANLLYQEKKYAEAGELYESLRGRDPGLDVLIAESLSFCYAAQKQFSQAAEVLEPLVQNSKLPYRGEVLRRQGLLYEQAGDKAKALACYRQLLKQNPDPALATYIKEKIHLLEPKPG